MIPARVNEAALAALAAAPGVKAGLLRVGEQVAERAASTAPRKSGAGAASIHAEAAEGYGGVPVVNVGWDRDHFYMMFSELGTSRMSARPFLRPALDATYTL